MYKVFIDQKPILIVEKEELSTKGKTLHIDDINNVHDEIWSKPFSNSDPLILVCYSPKEVFNRIFDRHTLIEAAGGIVRSEYGYLIIKRNGVWDIPKGKIDDNEGSEDAAVREIEEECGIESPKIEGFITETYHVYHNRGKSILKKTYWYFLSYSGPRKLIPQKDEGISEVVWMNDEEMFSISENTYGSINEVLNVFRKKYLD